MDALKSQCCRTAGFELVVGKKKKKTTIRPSPFFRFSFHSPNNTAGAGGNHLRGVGGTIFLVGNQGRTRRKPGSRSASLESLLVTAAVHPQEEADEYNFVEPGIQAACETVHVRFVLDKACLFGQQIFIVGDDRLFGQWDPSDALPLEWSDGHVWTTELDLPIGKSIRFKLVLQSFSGEVNWQPGPDRILRVWETTNTIIVTEDWENAENQKITEEEPLATPTEDVVTTEGMLAGNSKSVLDEIAMGENVENRNITEEPLASLTEDMVTTLIGGNGISVLDEMVMGVTTRSQISTEDKRISQNMKDEVLTSYEANLLLVPGLASVTVPMTTSVFTDEVVNGKMDDVLLANNEDDSYNASQLFGEQTEPVVTKTNLLKEETMTSNRPIDDDGSQETPGDYDVFSEEPDSEDSSCRSTGSVLKNGLWWCRGMLRQFLLDVLV